MKKSILMIGLAISLMANAQVLNVRSVQQLPIAGGDRQVAGISHDGSYILLTNNQHEGLSKYVLATGELEVLSTAPGAGYRVTIAEDDQTVVYREKQLGAGRMMRQQLVQRNLQTKEQKTLVAGTRDMRMLQVAGQVQAGRPMVTIENQQLVLTLGGSSRVVSPCGTNASYIWPSVSPDAKHILFYVCGRGAYVCDITGKNVVFLGRDVRAPKWYDNEVVVGMHDEDNGEVTTKSEIVAVSLSGQKQVLTQGINAMYPYACAGKIVCTGFEGETYLITVE